VVIGAGVGGLSCAALTSKYGLETLCVEAHDTAGGCAHSFTRYTKNADTKSATGRPFHFDSGPSLVSGLSSKSTNPLRQVLDAIGTADSVEWINYNGWMIHDTADGTAFKVTTGSGNDFARAIEIKAGTNAKDEFETFRDYLLQPGGLSDASGYIPPFALRGDVWAVATLAGYALQLLRIGPKGNMLTGAFSRVMEKRVKDSFVLKWFDYLAFALSGLDASGTQAAAVAYMMRDLFQTGAVLDYPKGGMGALVQALVTGMENHGGQLQLNSRVDKMILEEDNNEVVCKGVVLADGSIIRARKGVVCNAPLWNMARILEDSVTTKDGPIAEKVNQIKKDAAEMMMTGSFMHLHLGIPKDGLPDDLECHHSVLDLSDDVTAEQNMVIISIPTLFDPSLAPEGYHVVHAYTAACDSFDQWEKFLPNEKETGKVGHSPNSAAASAYKKGPGYQALKDEKVEVLWKAIEKVLPDVRERAKRYGSITMIATPLTHRRYNQRFRGAYGPAPSPGEVSIHHLRSRLDVPRDIVIVVLMHPPIFRIFGSLPELQPQ
jgi:phytoene dehydrogenase-like protein